MNRVGDVGLSIAIFLMFSTFGVVSFSGVFGAIGGASAGVATALGLLLLLGACGKSGQFPLQAWLPGRDGGPDPGLRADPRGDHGHRRRLPDRPGQPDLRRGTDRTARRRHRRRGHAALRRDHRRGQGRHQAVLAYSTVSQIGYMFLAVGLGPAAYALGILHLLTHGFFKAGLFLGAGSVMHGMNDQVDMRRFGGLWKIMPITFWTFAAGYLALIGLPPFSGFFSKDPIIDAAFDRPGWTGWVFGGVALFAAGLTAFYMTRLMIMTFFGERRWTDDVHPHESPTVMTVPMLILAVGSVGAGAFLVSGDRLVHWLEPVFGPEPEVVQKISELSVVRADRGLRPRRNGRGLARLRSVAGADHRAGPGLGGHRGGPAQPLRRRLQRDRLHAARACGWTASWSGSTTAGWTAP